jgi:hypothetical protein
MYRIPARDAVMHMRIYFLILKTSWFILNTLAMSTDINQNVSAAETEVKVAATEVKAAATIAPPIIPKSYAKYVDERCLQLIDSKKSPNKEFIAFLLGSITARFRSQYPTLGEDFVVKMEMSAQVQIIMLMRILCISALGSGFSNILYGCFDNLREHFNLASIEHDAWAWFAGAAGPQEKCSVFLSLAIPDELLSVAEKIVSAEDDATSLPGSSVRDVDRGDRAVECILTISADTISRLVFDFFSPLIDLDGKTSIRLSSTDINGILRLFNHGRIQSQFQFFIELGQFGNKFEALKREVKAKEAALKPPKAARKKKT